MSGGRPALDSSLLEQARTLEHRLGRHVERVGEGFQDANRGRMHPALELTQVGIRHLRTRREVAQRQVGELALGMEELAERLELLLPRIVGHDYACSWMARAAAAGKRSDGKLAKLALRELALPVKNRPKASSGGVQGSPEVIRAYAFFSVTGEAGSSPEKLGGLPGEHVLGELALSLQQLLGEVEARVHDLERARDLLRRTERRRWEPRGRSSRPCQPTCALPRRRRAGSRRSS